MVPARTVVVRFLDATCVAYESPAECAHRRLIRAMFRRFGVTAEPTRLVQRGLTAAPLNPDLPDRWILAQGPDSWPGYIELIDGSFVPLGGATKHQLREG
jgi:hypothetical protein